jgi:hypothetical protein
VAGLSLRLTDASSQLYGPEKPPRSVSERSIESRPPAPSQRTTAPSHLHAENLHETLSPVRPSSRSMGSGSPSAPTYDADLYEEARGHADRWLGNASVRDTMYSVIYAIFLRYVLQSLRLSGKYLQVFMGLTLNCRGIMSTECKLRQTEPCGALLNPCRARMMYTDDSPSGVTFSLLREGCASKSLAKK